MIVHRTTLAGLLLLAAASRGDAQSRLAKPTIDTVNHHIVRVMNSGPTAWTDTNGWKLVYERTVQPKDGSPGELDRVAGVVLLDDGRLVEVEQEPAAIRLYDARGNFVRNLGRAGAGPGEYRDPSAHVLHDTLVLQDPGLSRGTVMTLGGNLVRTFTTDCCNYTASTIDDRGRLRVVSSGGSGGSMIPRQWVDFDVATGRRVDSITPPSTGAKDGWVVRTKGATTTSISTSIYTIPLAGAPYYLELHDGTVLYGRTDRYELLVTRTGRDTMRIFGRRDLTPVTASPALRDSLFHSYVDHNEHLRAVASANDIPATFPPWTFANEDRSGNIWIARGGVWGEPRQYDVFAPDGRLLGAVAAPFSRAYVASWGRDHLAVLDTDESDLPRIRIFRIDRRGH
jgi:hypothetical protein